MGETCKKAKGRGGGKKKKERKTRETDKNIKSTVKENMGEAKGTYITATSDISNIACNLDRLTDKK